jgi:hypothetical protein
MDRRVLSRALIGVAAGSALLSKRAAATGCATGPCYPATIAENNAGFSPNTAYSPGNFLRYGADPTGINASDTALQWAIQFATTNPSASTAAPSAPGTVYAPAGLYTFTMGVSTMKNGNPLPDSFTLIGDGRGDAPLFSNYPSGPQNGGTVFQLNSSSASAAFLTFANPAQFIRIEKIQFALLGTLGQYCLNFKGGLRDSLIDDCFFQGNASSTNTGCIGIAIQTPTSTFSGDVDIRHCEFANHYVGVSLGGPCTTVRITTSEFYGHSVSSTYGIDMGALCAGVLVEGCTFESWGIGIYSQGMLIRQIGNYFEGNTANGQGLSFDWYWAQGSGNKYVANSSVADINSAGGPLTALFPPSTNCYVVGPGAAGVT